MPVSVKPDPALPCPVCQATGGVQRAVSTRAYAWSCTTCGRAGACSGPNPFLQQLAEEVRARSLLQEVRTLAEEAPRLSDGQLRARALLLLAALDRCARSWCSY